MYCCKKSFNLLLSIPPLSYKSQPKTPSVDIENINIFNINELYIKKFNTIPHTTGVSVLQ
jgi:hypothetical protein